MILKSFFHKKTTKVYLVITILLALIIALSFNLKNYYKTIINDAFKGSYYYIDKESYDKYFNDISKDYDIKETKKIINLDNSSDLGINFYIDNNLKDDEIGISKYFIENGVDHSENLYLANINYDFIKVYDYDLDYKVFAINENTLNKLSYNKKDAYVFTLEDWSLTYNFADYSSEKFDEVFSLNSTQATNEVTNYFGILNILKVIPFILAIVYIILFIIMVVNIINDDSSKNKIYSEVGYSKREILENNIIKILIMLIIFLATILISYLIIDLII